MLKMKNTENTDRRTKIGRLIVTLLTAAVIITTPAVAVICNPSLMVSIHAKGNTESGNSTSGNSSSENSTSENATTEPTTSENVIEPDVKIKIVPPSGWYKKSASVKVTITDQNNSGRFFVSKVEAKMGEDSTYEDITDMMKLVVYEDGPVYVLVTDSSGNTYTRSAYIECFDTDRPSVAAAVNNGLLTVQAVDSTSGVAKIFVNSTEFTDLTDGTVSVQLQQFDSTFSTFMIQAMDNAGNMSNIYSVTNPYYNDGSDKAKAAAATLPTTAVATSANNTSAGTVVEHSDDTQTLAGLGTMLGNLTDTVASTQTSDQSQTVSDNGKEFYTIATKNNKTFYLVIDKNSDTDNALLLTQCSNADLLNFSGEEAETLNQDSSVVVSSLPEETAEASTEAQPVSENNTAEEPVKKKKSGNNGPVIAIIAFIIIAAAGYYIKVYKPKHSGSQDDDEDERVNEDEDDEDTYDEDFSNAAEEEGPEPSDDTPDEETAEQSDERKEGSGQEGFKDEV